MTRAQYRDLKALLEQRRQDLQATVYGKIQRVRGDRVGGPDRACSADDPEADIHGDIDLALIQINAEMVDRITDALARLEKGEYGRCLECDEEIGEKRLRALPFASRCKDCQEATETIASRRHARTRGASAVGSPFGTYER